jgi:hypothetical protein
MVQYSPGTWRDYVWVSAALAGANLLLIIVFYPESNFARPHTVTSDQVEVSEGKTSETFIEDHAGNTSHMESSKPHAALQGVQHVDHVQVPWTSIWFSFFKVDHEASLPTIAIRPIIALIHPAVVWAVFVYGSSLAAQVTIM